MFKFKVTNTSADRGAKFSRPIFLTEVGKLLNPGASCPTNRIEKGTRTLEEVGDIKIEEGEFPALLTPKKKVKRVRVEDDDDDDIPSAKKDKDDGPVGFRDNVKGKRSNVLPLPAAGAEEEKASGEDEEDVEVMASTRDDEDLDAEIPSASKPSTDESSGFVDVKLSENPDAR